MWKPSQADLVRRRLMTVSLKLYASPEYLAAHGTPESMEDLADHRIISQNSLAPQVNASAKMIRKIFANDIASHLMVNNYFGILQGVIHNLGIGVLPDYLTEDFPNLVQLLPEETSNDVPVYLAYPEELRHSKRVEAFRDFVIDEVIAYRRRNKELLNQKVT